MPSVLWVRFVPSTDDTFFFSSMKERKKKKKRERERERERKKWNKCFDSTDKCVASEELYARYNVTNFILTRFNKMCVRCSTVTIHSLLHPTPYNSPFKNTKSFLCAVSSFNRSDRSSRDRSIFHYLLENLIHSARIVSDFEIRWK